MIDNCRFRCRYRRQRPPRSITFLEVRANSELALFTIAHQRKAAAAAEAMWRPMARQAVAAGDGAFKTWIVDPMVSITKSSTRSLIVRKSSSTMKCLNRMHC